MKKNNEDFYRVPCDPLETVLLVKKFDMEEELDLFKVTKKKVESVEGPLDIESYMDYVIKTFMADYETVVDHFDCGDDGDDVFVKDGDLVYRKEIKKAIYDCILALYPPFQLEFVCAAINKELFVNDMGTLFQNLARKNFEVSFGRETQAKELSVKTLRDVTKVRKFLEKNLIGQDHAIESVVKSLKVVAAGLSDFCSFFFIGPTGVGKTQMSRLLGEKYSGNFYKINCAEYSGGHEYAKLIGSPPGYIGHSERSLLGDMAEKSNSWVLVFDEIEKANPKFHDFLLSLLDDGTVTDNLGNILDFTSSIFIFTSNQGVRGSKVGEETMGFGGKVRSYGEAQEEILKSVKKEFNPEFLNRMDNFIFFNSLTKEDIAKITELELKDIPIRKTKALIAYITENGYSEEYGARNIGRFIKNNIATEVADAILNKKVPTTKGAMYSPRIVGGKLRIVNLKDFKEKTDELDEKAQDASSC